jgi:RNA polymerase sigma factor (sigma-70 family)
MSTANIISLNDSKRRRVVLSHLPQVPPLTASWYGQRERTFLRSLFSEPIEYVDHELFAKPSAELLIFGTMSSLVDGAAQFADEGDDSSCGLDGLTDNDTPTAGQETLLFQRLNYARMRLAQLVCRLVEQSVPLDVMRELLAWGHRVNMVRDRLTRMSLPLVPAMAKQSRFQGLDFSELASEGNCALVRAIMTFDCSRGYRFSTYACRAILKSFARVVLRTTRYRNRFPVEFDPEQERGDAAELRRDDCKLACLSELKVMLAKNRAQLTDIEQTVIRERFALDEGAQPAVPKTLDEIGEMIGVTKERVRQIQNKALAKLRHDMEKNYLAA